MGPDHDQLALQEGKLSEDEGLSGSRKGGRRRALSIWNLQASEGVLFWGLRCAQSQAQKRHLSPLRCFGALCASVGEDTRQNSKDLKKDLGNIRDSSCGGDREVAGRAGSPLAA